MRWHDTSVSKSKQILLYLLISCGCLADIVVYQQEVVAIAKEFKCMVCQGQSVADSDASFARDIRKLIAKKLAQGTTQEAIKTELIDHYGEAIRLVPSTRHAVLWYYPYAIITIIVGTWGYHYTRTIYQRPS